MSVRKTATAPSQEKLSRDVFDGGNFSDDGSRTMECCKGIAAYLLALYDISPKPGVTQESAASARLETLYPSRRQ